ncbi:MAG: hypothetical protein Q4P08_01000 [Eubacteriales bacterium]|nr:hypothetical protein [Eubacteriales bacterium]
MDLKVHQQLIDTIASRMKCLDAEFEASLAFVFYDMGNPENDTHLRGFTINPGFSEKSLPDFDRILQRLEDDPRKAWAARVHPEALQAAERFLGERGFKLTEPEGYPVMHRTEPILRDLKHQIKLLTRANLGSFDFQSATALLAKVFKLTIETAEKILWAALNSPDEVNQLAVIKADEVISLGLLTQQKDQESAGLYYISTAVERRGEGLAKDLVSYLSNLAFEQGAKEVILQASSLGEIVYRQLAYEEVGRYYHFDNK